MLLRGQRTTDNGQRRLRRGFAGITDLRIAGITELWNYGTTDRASRLTAHTLYLFVGDVSLLIKLSYINTAVFNTKIGVFAEKIVLWGVQTSYGGFKK